MFWVSHTDQIQLLQVFSKHSRLFQVYPYGLESQASRTLEGAEDHQP